MKIWNNKSFLEEALKDFLNANFGAAIKVGEKGKIIMEITDSQIKGEYRTKESETKLKPIHYSQDEIMKRNISR